MAKDSDERSAFFKGLDQTERIAANIGLVLSGIAFAAGIAGLVYVAINVMSTSPPSLGSQGEWLYGGLACLLVAGWGFSQAAKFFARLRNVQEQETDPRMPRIQIGSDGLSIDLPPLGTQNAAAKGSFGGLTWSFSSSAMPFKTFKLDDAQLAAADLASRNGAESDAVCRQINPEYATLSEIDQQLYRHAVQMAIEDRRSKARGSSDT